MPTIKQISTKKQLSDIALDVSWAKVSQRYFGKSASWIYNKLNEVDGNGGKGGFTDEEKTTLKNALYDFAERIRNTADKIH
ncbi:DUF5053 domain-containing protein [Niabella ginsengisoli]|uniref:DUF5053 domain-containing protein n=1 Tax=Niabella ginsengisoli TaxID=522298 RepID=A0ABS9SN12_9BACT|nr:DUF5053 domain-containing protein [Niabella ginsengisoli]MCH5599776.1 DUF5053 domain-containing protein [Niabella ginsengisoli]